MKPRGKGMEQRVEGRTGVSFASGKSDTYLEKIIANTRICPNLMLNSFTAGLIKEETLFNDILSP